MRFVRSAFFVFNHLGGSEDNFLMRCLLLKGIGIAKSTGSAMGKLNGLTCMGLRVNGKLKMVCWRQ